MSSKLNIGSKIYNATTGVESGEILHDGNYTATTSPTATDTLLIRQAGVQKQVTHKDLMGGFVKVKSDTGVFYIGGTTAQLTNDVIWESGKAYQFYIVNTQNGFQEDAEFLFQFKIYSSVTTLRSVAFVDSFIISVDGAAEYANITFALAGDSSMTTENTTDEFDDSQLTLASSYNFDIYMKEV